jgi:hypothetical protein
MSKHENKSVKSSDNSSSGNGSDVELLSSKSKSKKSSSKLFMASQQQKLTTSGSFYQQQTNYYEIGHISANEKKEQPRTLDKVPSDLRLSKQSFHAAMGNPCEFFIDVM